MHVVSVPDPNQPQRGSLPVSDLRWGWFGSGVPGGTILDSVAKYIATSELQDTSLFHNNKSPDKADGETGIFPTSFTSWSYIHVISLAWPDPVLYGGKGSGTWP